MYPIFHLKFFLHYVFISHVHNRNKTLASFSKFFQTLGSYWNSWLKIERINNDIQNNREFLSHYLQTDNILKPKACSFTKYFQSETTFKDKLVSRSLNHFCSQNTFKHSKPQQSRGKHTMTNLFHKEWIPSKSLAESFSRREDSKATTAYNSQKLEKYTPQ